MDLSKLYQLIQQKRILSPQKLNLLRFIHSNIRVEYGDISIKSTNGVPQGLTTSPHLFNIFSESLLTQLELAGLKVYAYADDIAFVGESLESIRKGIQIAQLWSS